MSFESICVEIQKERRRQEEIFGIQEHSPLRWIPILGEEYGEVSKAVNDAFHLRRMFSTYRTELIHLAATAIAAAECFDAGRW